MELKFLRAILRKMKKDKIKNTNIFINYLMLCLLLLYFILQGYQREVWKEREREKEREEDSNI